jgi:hypothetical protein
VAAENETAQALERRAAKGTTLPEKIMIPNSCRDTKQKTAHFTNPSPEAIPGLWAELCALGDIAPVGRREGIGRARTALLASVPPWRIPEVLDGLAAGGQPA